MIKKILTILLMMIPLMIAAQDADGGVQVTVNVTFLNMQNEKLDTPPAGMRYGFVTTQEQANEVERKLKEIIAKYREKGNKKENEADRQLEIEKVCNENNIRDLTANGYFKAEVLLSMIGFLVAPVEGEYVRINLKPGQTVYNFEKSLQQTKDVDVIGKKQPVAIKIRSINTGSGEQIFDINIQHPEGIARTDSRFILQLYAADCQTDDTVAYVSSMVLEGDEYHEKAIRRNGYDYQNDKLAKLYSTKATLSDTLPFQLDTTIVWKKEDPNRRYRGPFTYIFEDYHHVYFIKDTLGTCLEYSPFKLLSFEAAASEIPLTEEFYVQAGTKFENRDRKIDLRFEMGTARLIQDSLNNATQENLIKELRSYGKSLAQVTIMGAASPDGSLRRNEELANQRVAVAQGFLTGKIPVSANRKIMVYTWSDVANTLRDQKKEDQAQAVEQVIQSGGDDLSLTAKMKALPFYDMDVIPILEAQRTMRCSYKYIADFVMTADECVAEYYKNKRAYINFEKHFSNGDYYNLFKTIKDSLELDTITVMAYKEIVGEPEYEIENIISPYVCNRYAVMQMKRGTPNVEILRPFIDLNRHGAKGKGGIDVQRYSQTRARNVTWNRHEIIANQAAAYYMQERGDTARFLVEWLKNTGHADESVQQLEHLVNLSMYHLNAHTEEEIAKYEAARTAVTKSDENKAILYTEVEEWNMRHEAPYWVNKLQDDNPKKWYLKGLLAAFDNKKLGDLVVTPERPRSYVSKSDTTFYMWPKEKYDLYDQELQHDSPEKKAEFLEYQQRLVQYRKDHAGQDPPLEPKTVESGSSSAVMATKFKGVPQYLGYFQHCFDLDAPNHKYWRFYHREDCITEDMRKKHGYKIKERPIYRAMFEQMKLRDESTSYKLPGDEKEDGEKTVGDTGANNTDGGMKETDKKEDAKE